jgi:molybdenum cofactor sulfurtransferase
MAPLTGVTKIQSHVAALTEWTFEAMTKLKHSNGAPMVKIFGKHGRSDQRKVQGGIINFEPLSPSGQPLSYRTFEREAAAAGFHVRTGAECNPGACYAYLGGCCPPHARRWQASVEQGGLC